MHKAILTEIGKAVIYAFIIASIEINSVTKSNSENNLTVQINRHMNVHRGSLDDDDKPLIMHRTLPHS